MSLLSSEKKSTGLQRTSQSYASLWKWSLLLIAAVFVAIILRLTPIVMSLSRESSPEVRLPYVTLNLVALAKFELLTWGWEEKGIVFDILDSIGDQAYQSGLSKLPKNDGEQYIWYYLRYFYYYPDLSLHLLQKIQMHKDVIFDLAIKLANAPIENTFMDKYKRYDVVGILLGAHLAYLDKYRAEASLSLQPSIHSYIGFVSKFSQEFYRSLPMLMSISQWKQPQMNYFFVGMSMAQGNVALSLDPCESSGIKIFHYAKDNAASILKKMSKEDQGKWNTMLANGLQKNMNKLIDQQCHF